MKKIFKILFLIALIGVVYYIRPIYTYIDINYLNKQDFTRELLLTENHLVYNTGQKYVETTTKTIAENKQDLLNIIYTSLNYGLDEINFYCDEKYVGCFNDLNDIASSDTEISFINDLVHPYNKYMKITIGRNNIGKISINYEKLYSKEQIEFINKEVDKIVEELNLNSADLTDREKVKLIHDYIINLSKYSTENNDDKTAYGLLFNKTANCRGYTETTSILLNRAGIDTLPISNGHHVWNLVKLNNKWYHLDVTWDDPVSSDGTDHLIYDYYLINSEKLESLNADGEHIYDTNYYNPDVFVTIE